ncbi:MAG TPA: hypothetical protein VK453_26845 [Micromonosporaceae bacterium]|nr:hypothetical protein [Micromonosporaceae bacterium]
MSIVGAVGRGMIAGAVGTVAMTVTQRAEMALTDRKPSTVPGQVGAHLIPGRDPDNDADVQQLNAGVHWGHGISMGAVRGLLRAAGLSGPAASAAHFALLWVSDVVLYKSLGIAEAPWRWTGREITTDLAHKGVYAAVTGAAYDALTAKATR